MKQAYRQARGTTKTEEHEANGHAPRSMDRVANADRDRYAYPQTKQARDRDIKGTQDRAGRKALERVLAPGVDCKVAPKAWSARSRQRDESENESAKLTRQGQDRERTEESSSSGHVQHTVALRIEDRLGSDGRDRGRESPERREHAGRGSSDGSREGLRRVGVQSSRVGGLEEVCGWKGNRCTSARAFCASRVRERGTESKTYTP